MLKAGDATAFPIGPDGAHKASNATEEPVRFLMLSTKLEPSVAVYPDSGKIGVWTPNKDEHVLTPTRHPHRLLRRRGVTRSNYRKVLPSPR